MQANCHEVQPPTYTHPPTQPTRTPQPLTCREQGEDFLAEAQAEERRGELQRERQAARNEAERHKRDAASQLPSHPAVGAPYLEDIKEYTEAFGNERTLVEYLRMEHLVRALVSTPTPSPLVKLRSKSRLHVCVWSTGSVGT